MKARCGLFGKRHLDGPYPCRPRDRGFDEAAVCRGIWKMPDYIGNDHGHESYRHNGRFEKHEGFRTNVPPDQGLTQRGFYG